MSGVCAGNLAASISVYAALRRDRPPSLRFDAASSEQLSLSRLGFTEEKRKGAGALQDASRGSEAIGTRQRLGLSTLRPTMRD